jgi:hypothetical protein
MSNDSFKYYYRLCIHRVAQKKYSSLNVCNLKSKSKINLENKSSYTY